MGDGEEILVIATMSYLSPTQLRVQELLFLMLRLYDALRSELLPPQRNQLVFPSFYLIAKMTRYLRNEKAKAFRKVMFSLAWRPSVWQIKTASNFPKRRK